MNRQLYGDGDEPYAALSQRARRLDAAIAADPMLALSGLALVLAFGLRCDALSNERAQRIRTLPLQAAAEPVLVVEGLARRFGTHEVVHSLAMTLGLGERIALRGPNGSGKTTVLRCIAGTVTPSGGRVSIGGHPAGTIDACRLVGVSLSQERSFYLRLTGHDNLLFFARLRYRSNREALRRVDALEEELELAEIARERVDHCSTGMTQQLAFARALLGEPRVLLLDEPTRSLDQHAVDRFWQALDRRREGLALLIATHRPDDVARCEEEIELPA